MTLSEQIAAFDRRRSFVSTEFGRIAVVDVGGGPAAVFLHGFPLHSLHWRDVFAALGQGRRLVAIDLLGLGHTEALPGLDLSFPEQARMILTTLDRLGIAAFDLVGNDSGCGVGQLVAAMAPERLRSLTLTNGDCHDNFPPEAFANAFALAGNGLLANTMASFVDNIELARSPGGLGSTFESCSHLTAELVRAYLAPQFKTAERRAQFDRYVAALNTKYTLAIGDKLRALMVPTQMVWGTADIFFPLKWAYWLNDTIPGARRVVEAEGGKLFYAEERPVWFAEQLNTFWTSVSA